MKKSFILVAFLAAMSVVAYAQPRAIGANLGGGLGFSYQHGFGESNMLDVAVYVPIWSWGLAGSVTYDWIDPFGATVPWNDKGEWHWYMGVGGGGGIYGYVFGPGQPWFAGVVGHIGIEYDFWFPFQLSFDWRPNFGVCGTGTTVLFNPAGLWEGLQLGVRYKF